MDERRQEAVQALAQTSTNPLPQRPPRSGPALEELFRSHHEAVFRAAYRVTGNAMDAEDVLQTVFVRLLRREEALNPDEGIPAYLHRAAVNAALDLLRQRKRAGAVALDELGEGPADEITADPSRRAQSRQAGDHLRSALARLSPRAAEIFSLRYFEGLGNLEIARLLGTSQTAIAVLLHRSRHRLQKDLAPFQGVQGGLS